ncbi:MAG: hypothetical protein ALMCE001_01010 [Methanocorpusculum sp. MCE]|nr:MAG: hypothetical protein ALMCE001_01010 [Methanocorpusculum sp. MCE]
MDPIERGEEQVWKHEIKTNRESARIRPSGERIGFASPHSHTYLARQSLARLRPPLRVSPPSTCSSLIGSVRANPVAAQAAPKNKFSSSFSLKKLPKYFFHFSHRRRRGADMICPDSRLVISRYQKISSTRSIQKKEDSSHRKQRSELHLLPIQIDHLHPEGLRCRNKDHMVIRGIRISLDIRVTEGRPAVR